MNERNLCSLGFKKPFQKNNEKLIKEFLSEAEEYIRELKLINGISLLNSNRKTGFLGFLVSMRSLITLYNNLVGCLEPQLQFLMSYKMSQDHIEPFFSQIRSMGGCNNNPTVRQFSAAYKRILVHNDIQDVLRSNCIPLESVHILTASSSSKNGTQLCNPSVLAINSSMAKINILNNDIFEIVSDVDNEEYTIYS